jgi:hypothetical protein
MTLTIEKLLPSKWYAGMLMDAFAFVGGATGDCHSCIYRNGMQSVGVTVRGVGRRGFALATMPLNWVAKVGDVVTIHPSQL